MIKYGITTKIHLKSESNVFTEDYDTTYFCWAQHPKTLYTEEQRAHNYLSVCETCYKENF